ncbi:MAG TPA: diaminopimelate epimerase [bacterium]|nr:diaminopimelate epimerase [bacterium]HPG83689.1 diaminopimelate epimerase [bacterium]HPM58721.1 diaminopimelate epimerase [bacterium]
MKLSFVKISATGNDFILVDNRSGIWSAREDASFFSAICQHRRSVGADGVILLEESSRADFHYIHVNSDGSLAGMCGNGSRAVAWFARQLGIGGDELSFEISGSIYRARVEGRHVTTAFIPPGGFDLGLNVAGDDMELSAGGYIDTGVPHYVLFSTEVASVDVAGRGAWYRRHPAFPQGANIDFVQVLDSHHLRVRTYERGVEAETLACGTGAVASSVISHLRGRASSPVEVDFPGGQLVVVFNADYSGITLAGTVDPVYAGELWDES